jgi:hypothetical protein
LANFWLPIRPLSARFSIAIITRANPLPQERNNRLEQKNEEKLSFYHSSCYGERSPLDYKHCSDLGRNQNWRARSQSDGDSGENSAHFAWFQSGSRKR